MKATKLGRMQLRIVQVLWERGEASAREITEAMNETEPVAHSTVQTLLRTLEEKGAVGHSVEGRTFIFRPLVEEQGVQKSATRDVLERVFDGSVKDLVSYLLKNERVSRGELDEIRSLIDEKRGAEKRGAEKRGAEKRRKRS